MVKWMCNFLYVCRCTVSVCIYECTFVRPKVFITFVYYVHFVPMNRVWMVQIKINYVKKFLYKITYCEKNLRKNNLILIIFINLNADHKNQFILPTTLLSSTFIFKFCSIFFLYEILKHCTLIARVPFTQVSLLHALTYT